MRSDPGHGPRAVTTETLPVATAAEEPLPSPAFDDIFRTEAAYVSRTLRYLGVNEADIEDASQEVFVVVHRRLKEFMGGSTRAWVRQICVLVANNHRRSRRRRLEDPAIDTHEAESPAMQPEEVDRRRLRERLLALLDELPPDQRATFVLFEIEQLTMAETAEALGCPLQTAYSRLHAARAKIRAALEGCQP